MAFPLLLIPAIVAAVGGGGAAIAGGVEMNKAYNNMEEINFDHERNIRKFQEQNLKTCRAMDRLGFLELAILKDDFEEFSEVFEKIRDAVEFIDEEASGTPLPELNIDEIKKISFEAATVLNLVKSGIAGSAAAFAAAGAIPALVMWGGSTAGGTMIASLSGQAAINAMLAWLGGGSLAAGGGGMALGTIVLNTATLGVGFLIGGIAFKMSASSFSKTIEEAAKQVEEETITTITICDYLKDLENLSKRYHDALSDVRNCFIKQLQQLKRTVRNKTSHYDFTEDEKLNLKNTLNLVKILTEMCNVNVVIKNETEEDMNKLNSNAVEASIAKSKKILNELPSSQSGRLTAAGNAEIDRLLAETDELLK